VKGHLAEERLFECYVAERAGEPIDPPSAEHLGDCTACAARYTDLARFMDDIRSETDAEADALFSPEDLRAQQHQIARRIEHLGHPARVISFPGQGSPQVTRQRQRLAPRWVAAAAAAGLFIGIYVGTFVDRSRPVPDGTQAVAEAPQPQEFVAQPGVRSVIPEPVPYVPVVDDPNEQFLLELEIAAERPHTTELLALDELTPHVRPIRTGLP
jgi:hypothetical protein